MPAQIAFSMLQSHIVLAMLHIYVQKKKKKLAWNMQVHTILNFKLPVTAKFKLAVTASLH